MTIARSCCCQLRLGAWAKFFVFLSKLRLSAAVHAHIPNGESQKHLKDLIVVKIDDATHGGHMMKYIFSHWHPSQIKSSIAWGNFASSSGRWSYQWIKYWRRRRLQWDISSSFYCREPDGRHQVCPEPMSCCWQWQQPSTRKYPPRAC